MRLGQLARKHDIPVQEILTYLNEETGEKFHANAKLFDAIEEKIFKHFNLIKETPVVEPQDQTDAIDPTDAESEAVDTLNKVVEEEQINDEPTSAADDIASVDGELEISGAETTIEELPVQETSTEDIKPRPSEDEVIQTDRLLELLESEETPVDLEKIKLIKAPKKELSGLKVLGKVDLPEPKKKIVNEEEEAPASDRNRRNKRSPLTDEEREQRRLKAKRKKEAYEARQEKRRKEQETQRLKELKAKHYEQKLKNEQVNKKKKSTPKTKQTEAKIETANDSRPEPKTWLGKWWRWMNT
ncbi:hypothetical protein [Ekhidna sp.]|uniref:hypothetical protein n=1 Tax=Ekhidna sp. TaxID=2608089 RepID=UPI003B50CE99